MSVGIQDWFTEDGMAKKAKQPDPLSEAASAMVWTIGNRRSSGSRWLTWPELIERVSGLTPETATEALTKVKPKGRVIIAFPADPHSPVLLREDIEAFASDGEVLTTLAHRGCSGVAPVRTLAELTQPLEPSLKKAIDIYWPQHSDQLPAGLAPVLVGTKKAFAIHDEQFPRPEVDLSRELVAALEAQKSTGDNTYPAAWPTLLEAVGRLPDDDLIRLATAQPPFADSVKTMRATGVLWVAFAVDAPAILCNESFLRRLVQENCNVEQPEIKLSVLTQQIPKDLQARFVEAWTLARLQQLDFLEAESTGTAKKPDILLRDRRFPRPEIELSRKLVAILEAQKTAGDNAYPAAWPTLLEAAGVRSDDGLIRLATAKPPFAGAVRTVRATGSVWVAFTTDVPAVLSTESFLRRIAQEVCRAEQPEIKLSALAKQLPKDLQVAFIESWPLTRLQQLDFIEVESAGSTKKPDVLFRDRRFPRAEALLAEKLVKVLTSQKELGGTSYPSTWSCLIELTDAQATQTVRAKAELMEPYRSQVVVSFNAPDAPLALTDDEALLGDSPHLLSMVLATARTNDNQAVDVSKLVTHKGLHVAVQPHFQTSVERRIADRCLPDGIGALKIAKKLHLFRWEDAIGVNTETATGGASGSVDPAQFARDFDAAFSKLDGKLGLPKCASLVDLRPELPQYSREFFDKELVALRQVGCYSLSAFDGGFGPADHMRAACLIVDNVPHLLVHKK